MTISAETLIQKLQLSPHPEGGWFRETYRSTEHIQAAALPQRFTGSRSFGTAIYFLLEAGDFSAFHRIKQDEIWHYYTGGPLLIQRIDSNGSCLQQTLGPFSPTAAVPQIVIEAGTVFAAEADPDTFTLCGCTVAPGFDFADFSLPGRSQLMAEFPEHRHIITRLTRT